MSTPNDSIMHYGVLGMKWGRRKQPNSPDHTRAATIRKTKKVREMTDEELAFVTKRVRLETTYRNNPRERIPTRLDAKRKSNSELELQVERDKLIGEIQKDPRRWFKRLSKMSTPELRAEKRKMELETIEWKKGLRKSKPIPKMSEEEVKALLKRTRLEQEYRQETAKETGRVAAVLATVMLAGYLFGGGLK